MEKEWSEERADELQRAQQEVKTCENEELCYRLSLAQDAGNYNRNKHREAREKLGVARRRLARLLEEED